jgi:hypothetical protein
VLEITVWYPGDIFHLYFRTARNTALAILLLGTSCAETISTLRCIKQLLNRELDPFNAEYFVKYYVSHVSIETCIFSCCGAPNGWLELYREGQSLFRVIVLLTKYSQAKFQDDFSHF